MITWSWLVMMACSTYVQVRPLAVSVVFYRPTHEVQYLRTAMNAILVCTVRSHRFQREDFKEGPEGCEGYKPICRFQK